MAKSVGTLQTVAADPQVVAFVAGVSGRSRAFTVATGSSMAGWPNTVEMESVALERLGQQMQAGVFDAAEKFRNVRALFTPATASTFVDNPCSRTRWCGG